MDNKPNYPLPDQKRLSSQMNSESSTHYWTPQKNRYNHQLTLVDQTPRLSIAERFMAPSPRDSTPPMNDSHKRANEVVHHHQSLPFSEETSRESTIYQLSNTCPNHPARLKHKPYKAPRCYEEESPRRLESMHPSKVTTHIKTAATVTTCSDSNSQLEKSLVTWPTKEKTSTEEGFWYCHRGCLLLCLFFSILTLGFVLFLVWPRVPLLRIEGASIVTPVEIVQTQQVWMQNVMFTTSWLVNVTVDNRQNYIPTRLNKVQVIVKDAVTNALVGKGSRYDGDDLVLMDGISTVSLLVNVNYQARDMSDATFLDLVHACHRTLNDPPSSLPLHFWITLYMFGFDWLGFTPTIIATPASSGFFCPV